MINPQPSSSILCGPCVVYSRAQWSPEPKMRIAALPRGEIFGPHLKFIPDRWSENRWGFAAHGALDRLEALNPVLDH